MNEKVRLPKSWRETLFNKADLDESFREFTGCNHFFADAIRGRIRSLQMRFAEAWSLFDKADKKSVSAEENIPNLIRKFLLEIYRFENALAEAPIKLEPDIIETTSPLALSLSLSEYPEVKYVVDLRSYCEAKLMLHLGSCEEAAEIYETLIRDNPAARPERLASYYIDMAACQQGLGRMDEAERNLQNAEFAVAAIDETLDAARLAASLFALYRFLGERQKAEEWKSFLLHLHCPKTTKVLFARRARHLLERCLEHSRLVSF